MYYCIFFLTICIFYFHFSTCSFRINVQKQYLLITILLLTSKLSVTEPGTFNSVRWIPSLWYIVLIIYSSMYPRCVHLHKQHVLSMSPCSLHCFKSFIMAAYPGILKIEILSLTRMELKSGYWNILYELLTLSNPSLMLTHKQNICFEFIMHSHNHVTYITLLYYCFIIFITHKILQLMQDTHNMDTLINLFICL